MYKLYVILGSHACRSAMLMLGHKRVPCKRIEFITITHPTMARLHGFDERQLLDELPPMLDRIDAWIADGVLGGEQPNAADFMVVPSLALTLYRPDVMPIFAGRPALELVDRLLPEPG